MITHLWYNETRRRGLEVTNFHIGWLIVLGLSLFVLIYLNWKHITFSSTSSENITYFKSNLMCFTKKFTLVLNLLECTYIEEIICNSHYLPFARLYNDTWGLALHLSSDSVLLYVQLIWDFLFWHKITRVMGWHVFKDIILCKLSFFLV